LGGQWRAQGSTLLASSQIDLESNNISLPTPGWAWRPASHLRSAASAYSASLVQGLISTQGPKFWGGKAVAFSN